MEKIDSSILQSDPLEFMSREELEDLRDRIQKILLQKRIQETKAKLEHHKNYTPLYERNLK